MSKCEIGCDGIKRYFNYKGEYHREDGPAYESDGYKVWYIDGVRHREDGPAREFITIDSGYGIEYIKEWYYKGKYIKCSSQEEFIKLIKLKNFW